jgi:hypothetical protein
LAVLAASFAAAVDAGEQPASAGRLEPWASKGEATDVARQHVEEIADGRHEYVVGQGGTVDGQSCRSPVGVYEGWEQTWESNRAVRLENVGRTDVVNPWLSNGRNNFRNIAEIAASAVEPGMSDEEKAIAIWYQEVLHRYHWSGTDGNDPEVKNPVKVFNVYGHNTCGDDSNCMAGLWKAAGLAVRPARVEGHCVTQVFYDGRWHLMDGDMHSLYLLRDNHTVAAEADVVRDHDLIKRSHTHGMVAPDRRQTDEWEASLYVYEGDAGGDRDAVRGHTMDMVLRPGEALTWRWGRLDPVKCHGQYPPKFPDTISNGLWEYRPDFGSDLWRQGAQAAEGVRATPDGLAAEVGRTGTVIWAMRSPYPFVGGRIEADGAGAEFALSRDGKEWQDVARDLDPCFPPGSPGCYAYFLRCRLTGEASLKRLGIVNDLQMTALALPAMALGENRFTYTDESAARKVLVTHEWVERSAWQPPAAPQATLYPGDAGEAEGTQVVFRWTPSVGADGTAAGDYHFELSERPDMRWPLSTNFRRLISRTADAGKAQYTLPGPGLLTPDRAYYWHVRARDAKGVWSPWGPTWSFTARGPAEPVNVRLEGDPAAGAGVLRWEPNPVGRRPAGYRVYGSDEKGFTAGDEPYDVFVGNRGEKLPTPFPANFVAETKEPQLRVVGVGLGLPNANRAFYRVVAVDERGNRSGPSEFAAGPRPFIYSRPVTAARVGEPYRYEARAIRSLGDLRAREGLAMSFWDVERPAFALDQAPAWLAVDPATGVLSGMPDAAGRFEVVLTAVTDIQVRQLDERQLSWGREKVLGVTTERVGAATQRFTIEVAG